MNSSFRGALMRLYLGGMSKLDTYKALKKVPNNGGMPQIEYLQHPQPITMITISDTHFKSDIALADILAVKTKADILKICDKLDLYVSPNLKKDETARRAALEILHHPIRVLSQLCKSELQLLDKF